MKPCLQPVHFLQQDLRPELWRRARIDRMISLTACCSCRSFAALQRQT